MVKTDLKDTYIGGTTPATLQNEVSTCQKIYYDKETRVMVNQSVNEFYIRFLFKNDKIPEKVVFPLDTTATFFNNLRPCVRALLISEGVQVPQRPPTETNNHGNQRLLLVRNAAVESENKKITIKAEVQPASVICHTSKLTGMLGGNTSTHMAGSRIKFQDGYKNSMLAVALDEYALTSAEEAYENRGQQEPMGFMASGGEFHESRNDSRWLYQKHPSFPILTGSDNSKWDTASVFMSVAEVSIRKATCRVNTSLE